MFYFRNLSLLLCSFAGDRSIKRSFFGVDPVQCSLTLLDLRFWCLTLIVEIIKQHCFKYSSAPFFSSSVPIQHLLYLSTVLAYSVLF